MRSLLLLIAALASVSISATPLSVNVSGGNPACGNNTGYAIAQAWGGVPPYTYLWSTTATTDTITGLAPGAYWVTVTDANSDQVVSQNINLFNDPTPSFSDIWPGAGLHGCHGQCNNGVWCYPEYMPLNLVPPFTFSPEPIYGLDQFNPDRGAWTGLCDGPQTFATVTDGLGCVAQLGVGFSGGGSDPGPMSVVSTQPSCAGMNGGSMTVNVGYEYNSAYTPLWHSTLLDENMVAVPGAYIGAIPLGGQNLATLSYRAPGDYFVERRFQNYQGDCVDLLPVTIPSLGTNCGAVSGTAFMDYNENCLNNAEPVVPSGILEVLPGPVYTSLNGSPYILCLVPGNYTIEQSSSDVAEHCTGAPIPFTITASTIPVQVHLPDTSLVALDLGVAIGTGPARPGFQFTCGINIQNPTPNASGAITLTMDFDATLSYVSAIPAPSSVAGNTLTWNQAQLTGWQSRAVSVQFTVPANPALIGTSLLNSVSVSSVNGDGDLANNSASATTTITGSYDPNDKLAATSTRTSETFYFIDEDEWIDYTIRFQNTGTDTAFNILVTDTLGPVLDPATLEIGAASHPFSWELREGGTLKFYFQNILLPDSNYSEPMSHGFVGFRIRPRLPLVVGTVIENSANIFFDFNPPVITEPSVITAEFSTGVPLAGIHELVVSPNPTDGMLMVQLPPDHAGTSILEVLAIDGRRMSEHRITGARTTLDLAALPAGLYTIRSMSANGIRSVSRFVRN